MSSSQRTARRTARRTKVFKRPKNITNSQGVELGERLLLTGGEYSVGDYLEAFVNKKAGGYVGSKVHVAMTFPDPDRRDGDPEDYFTTTLNTTSTVPWEAILNYNNRVAKKFIKKKNEDLRKIIRAMGDASRKLAEYYKREPNGDQIATAVFSTVFFEIFSHCRDIEYASGAGGDDANSESTATQDNARMGDRD